MNSVFVVYLAIYTIFAFGYIWYRYIFLLILKERYFPFCTHKKVTVIVPFYNEKPLLIERTVRKINECYGKKQIIVIDDGSKSKESYNQLKKLKEEISFELIRYDKNKGKRYAQSIGVKKAEGDIIITVDSDTILDKLAIINLIKPFSDKKIGATTGQVRVLNRNENLLTKMQSARYFNAFNFERNSQSKFSALTCLSGPISAYRKEILLKIMDDYTTQTFLGIKCTYGDDRHLTTLILKNGFKVYYVKDAIAYTEVPNSFKKLISQQIRWKKSFLRENYLVSKFMFKRSKALSFEIFITTFIIFFSLFARVFLVISLFVVPFFFLLIIPMILFMSTLHSLYILFYKPNDFFYSILYSFLHVFVIYWLIFIALFTLKDNRWGTR
ncbi:glycosyltransferase [Candidatus Pacearchaeota archaeon]|nr:glycosyltransferase [Candidatus Pacearchaeota archaeon]